MEIDIFKEIMNKIGDKNPLKLTFVCSGNICRSVYAEFAFKDMIKNSPILKKRLVIDSGGLVFTNISIDHRTTEFLMEEGIDRSISEKHIPRYKGNYPEMLDETDLIIGMTKSHRLNTPKRWRKGDEAKFVMISELAINKKIDIGDPYFTNSYEEYREILLKIKKYLLLIKEKFEIFYSK
jgi:protein-tyrosine-phosphatase